MPQGQQMHLVMALGLLASIHTRDDDVADFVVLVGAKAKGGREEFDCWQAWQTVRQAAADGTLRQLAWPLAKRPWWCPQWFRRLVWCGRIWR